jgi:hypothetical protein
MKFICLDNVESTSSSVLSFRQFHSVILELLYICGRTDGRTREIQEVFTITNMHLLPKYIVLKYFSVLLCEKCTS